MKYFSSFLLSIMIINSCLLIGCSTNKFDGVCDNTLEYTTEEKAEIYALAEKYSIELTPIGNKTNEPLLSIEELEEKFKQAYKSSKLVSTKSQFFEKTATANSIVRSSRLKTRSESEGGSRTFYWVCIDDSKYHTLADITVTWNNYRVTDVSISNVFVFSGEIIEYTCENLSSAGPFGNCTCYFDIIRKASNIYEAKCLVAKGMGHLANWGCFVDITPEYEIPGYSFYVKSNTTE